MNITVVRQQEGFIRRNIAAYIPSLSSSESIGASGTDNGDNACCDGEWKIYGGGIPNGAVYSLGIRSHTAFEGVPWGVVPVVGGDLSFVEHIDNVAGSSHTFLQHCTHLLYYLLTTMITTHRVL